MANIIIKLKNFSLTINDRIVLDKIGLSLCEGSVALLVGPNGSGKSSLLNSLMYDTYKPHGEAIYKSEDLLSLSTQDRAKAGILLLHQDPIEIPSVAILDFLRLSYNVLHPEEQTDPWSFKEIFDVYADMLDIPDDHAYRGINEDFSGGEKKKFELLQMLILQPSLVLIDEIDSGLDFESISKVFKIINQYLKEKKATALIVSHNLRILEYLDPSIVYLMRQGSIISSGDKEIVKKYLLKDL